MAQPDPRIVRGALGTLKHDGQFYLGHRYGEGCLSNALIETFDGYLRCNACFTPLTDDAAEFVLGTHRPSPWEATERGTFILKMQDALP